jgi:antitoxin component of MazEF toxin-antitoxin module
MPRIVPPVHPADQAQYIDACATCVLQISSRFNHDDSQRAQAGDAAVITIPADVLTVIDAEVGSTLELILRDGALTARPLMKNGGRRFTVKDLLHGTTPARLAKLNADTACARQSGDAVGREIG